MIDLHNAAAVLMIVFAALAFIDGVYLHLWRYRLFAHDDTRREHQLHTVRAWLFPVWVYLLFGVHLQGLALWIAVAVAGLDLLMQIGDMIEEGTARRRFGGLSSGEYVLHGGLTAIHAAGLALALLARPISDYTWASFAISPASAFSDAVTWLLLPGSILIATLHSVLLAGYFRKFALPSSEAAA